jgi:hypothetical protein
LASANYSRGRYGSYQRWLPPWPNEPGDRGCSTYTELLNGSCYLPPQPDSGEELILNEPVPNFQIAVEMRDQNGVLLPGCAGCGNSEHDLPPQSTVDVWVTTPSFKFFWPDAYPLDVVNGTLGEYANPQPTLGGWSEAWVEYLPYAPTNYGQTIWWLSRLAFTPSLHSLFRVRLSDPSAPPASDLIGGPLPPATDFNIWGWSTAASGQQPF